MYFGYVVAPSGIAPMPPQRPWLASIQYLRAVAVILVIGIHLYAFELHAGVATRVLPQWMTFGSSGVDLFFVISGFVMVYTNHSSATGLRSFYAFILRRLVRIFPLYWFVLSPLVGICLFMPELMRRSDLAELQLIRELLLLPSTYPPLLAVAWTLSHELYFYAVFSLFLLVPQRYWLAGLSIWSGVLVLAEHLWPATATNPVYALIVNPLTFEFLSGCLVAELHLRGLRRGAKVALVGGILAMLGIWLAHFHITNGAELGSARVLVFGIPFAFILYGCVALNQSLTGHKLSLLALIGDASYAIYLSHFLIISLIARGSSYLLPRLVFSTNGSWDNFAYCAIAFGASIALGLGLHLLIERPLLRYLHRTLNRWQAL